MPGGGSSSAEVPGAAAGARRGPPLSRVGACPDLCAMIGAMILRSWRGAVRGTDADRYAEHQSATGINDYPETEGNLGVLVLSRPRGELVEFVTLSLWESMDAVKRFAGEEPEKARFYPGDDDLLAEKDLHADHFELVEADIDPSLAR